MARSRRTRAASSARSSTRVRSGLSTSEERHRFRAAERARVNHAREDLERTGEPRPRTIEQRVAVAHVDATLAHRAPLRGKARAKAVCLFERALHAEAA